MELRKPYADNSSMVKTYDAYNRLATETDARGLLLGTTYSDGTTTRSYTYHHLGQVTLVVDDAGTRTLGYNRYGEQETDRLTTAEGVIHLITENRDEYGRNIGYTYIKDGVTQQTVTTGYDPNGRLSSAGFLHEGTEKRFYRVTSNNTKPTPWNSQILLRILTHVAYTEDLQTSSGLVKGLHKPIISQSLFEEAARQVKLLKNGPRKEAHNVEYPLEGILNAASAALLMWVPILSRTLSSSGTTYARRLAGRMRKAVPTRQPESHRTHPHELIRTQRTRHSHGMRYHG